MRAYLFSAGWIAAMLGLLLYTDTAQAQYRGGHRGGVYIGSGPVGFYYGPGRYYPPYYYYPSYYRPYYPRYYSSYYYGPSYYPSYPPVPPNYYWDPAGYWWYRNPNTGVWYWYDWSTGTWRR